LVRLTGLYKGLVRPLLFGFLSADMANELGQFALRHPIFWKGIRTIPETQDERLNITIGGIALKNPVGAAPGFDKHCQMIESMARMGFGYTIPGSITLNVNHKNNPKPRILRYSEHESLVNCVQIPSKGASYTAERLRHSQSFNMRIIPCIEDFTLEESVKSFEMLQPLSDGLEISLRCPNEPKDGYKFNFMDPHNYEKLLDAVNKHKTNPIFVKMRNYISEKERENRLELVNISMKNGVDAITIPGSLVVEEPRLSAKIGNLSGRAIYQKTLANIRDIYQETKGKIVIKARGGIHNSMDAFEAFRAGASTVELHTGLIYEGPSVARNICRGLLKLMDLWGFKSISEVIGSGRYPRAMATRDAVEEITKRVYRTVEPSM